MLEERANPGGETRNGKPASDGATITTKRRGSDHGVSGQIPCGLVGPLRALYTIALITHPLMLATLLRARGLSAE